MQDLTYQINPERLSLSNSKLNAVVLFSGGIDSTTTAVWAMTKGFGVNLLSIEYESRHNFAEMEAADKIAAHLKLSRTVLRVDIPMGGSALMWAKPIPETITPDNNPTVVPGRNLIMIGMAVGFAQSVGARSVVIGATENDARDGLFRDCMPHFLDTLSEATQFAYGVRVLHPFTNWSKSEVVEWGRAHDVPYELTWSCYDPVVLNDGSSIPCGACPACKEREYALRDTRV